MTLQRVVLADRWDYTVAELRETARENGITVTSRMTHADLVGALRSAGIELPVKPLQRYQGRRANTQENRA